MSHANAVQPTFASAVNANQVLLDESSSCQHLSEEHYYSTNTSVDIDINSGMPDLEEDEDSAVSPYEFWPAWIFYLPVIAQCLWLGLRYRKLALPLIANPGIEMSGLVGESKHAVLDLAGQSARQWIAPYIYVKRAGGIDQQLASIYAMLLKANLQFPLVAKPDIGCRGAGVRLIENDSHLRQYLTSFPLQQYLLLQQKAPYSAEAGVFYTRHPGQSTGQIISIALKYTPYVVGDGKGTLAELIASDKRAGQLQHLYLPRHQQRLDNIIPAGKKFPLTFAGSHCRGSIFRNGNQFITTALTQRLDEITKDIPGYYFGRLDIKFKNIDCLQRGKEFCIVEINGASSEAAHIWDRKTSLKEIFSTLLKQYRTLYAFGYYHYQQGHKPASVRQLLQAWKTERDLVVAYPTTD